MKKTPQTMGMYQELDITGKVIDNVRHVFLKLTETVNPYGTEHRLRKYLPDELKMDGHGNYYVKIGETETMFTCHLDQHAKEFETIRTSVTKVGIVSTLGNTILGADDKAGTVIMMCMIEARIPGLYYFFIGEESAMPGGGTFGSKSALGSYAEMFKKYKRCIAFDRRGKGSIISEQSWSVCCSQKFVSALSEEFKKAGMEFKDDPTGSWTDSAVFMNIIPECSNLSVGYANEHRNTETQDIQYLRELCQATLKVEWEKLPVDRVPGETIPSRRRVATTYTPAYNSSGGWEFDGFGNYTEEEDVPKKYSNAEEMFSHVLHLLMPIGYWCEGEFEFSEGKNMNFRHYIDDDAFDLVIKNMKISIDGNEIGSYEDLVKYTKTAETVTDIKDNARRDPKKNADEEEEEEDTPTTPPTTPTPVTHTTTVGGPRTPSPSGAPKVEAGSIIARHYKFAGGSNESTRTRRIEGFVDFY